MLVLFLPTLSSCPMIAEAMVNWLSRFPCIYSYLICFVYLDTSIRDNTDCLSHTMRLELALDYEIWGCVAIVFDNFFLCLFVTCEHCLWWHTIASEHMPYPDDYIGIHFGCVQSLLVYLFLWFFGGMNLVLCCALIASILVQLMFLLIFLRTLVMFGWYLVRKHLMYLFWT